MKKTLTVNLGGMVFHIDEDAYFLLDSYLLNLRSFFMNQEGVADIMDDFEARISELLHERIQLGYQVITIEDVESVIERMGKPEQIFEENTIPDFPNTSTQEGAHTKKVKKRLMRDLDNRMLGGVASGLAQYFGLDVTIFRLILIALLFLPIPIPFPGLIMIYILLWLVIPPAKTAADKLLMRGQSVNLENIGKAVTENFDQSSTNINNPIQSQNSQNAFFKFAEGFVAFFGILLKIGIILFSVILIPVFLLIVLVLVIVVVALVAGGVGAIFGGIPFIGKNLDLILSIPKSIAVLGSVSGILLIGIPIVAMVYMLFSSFLKLNPIPTGAKWALIVIWLISLILCIISSYTIFSFNIYPHWSWIGMVDC